MPKVRRSKKSPPEGWELIEPTLEELEQKMREGNYFRLCLFIKTVIFCLLTLICLSNLNCVYTK